MAKAKKSKVSHKMKSYDSFSDWMADQSPKNQTLIKHLRKMVNGTSLGLDEAVKWGNGCWVKDDLPVIYLYADQDMVQFGFFAGSMLTDKKDLLKGKGKYVRHIPVSTKADIDEKYFIKLAKEATKIVYR